MDIGKILGMSKKDNVILLNTIYHSKIDEDNKHDAISLIFKDMNTGDKFLKEIIDPKIEVYKAKEYVDLGDANHICIEREKLNKYDVSYKNRRKDLATLLGSEAEKFYNHCIKTRQFKEINRILMDNRLFSSDRNIEDFYRYKTLNYFGEKQLNKTTKGFFDIEADIMYGNIDFKTNTGEAPVNAITLIDAEHMTVYTLLLRNIENPLIQELEDGLPDFIKELKNELNEDNMEFEFKLAFFDDELDLIKTFFKLVNTINLDFLLAWNMNFDINYLIYRIKVNGGSPKQIICHPDFQFRECNYVGNDEFEIQKKTDYFIASTYTIWQDQMINYAAIRKSQSKLDSYKLDFIGGMEVGYNKLEYDGHIRDLPWTDYRTFVKYNIRDCIVQHKIEKKVGDIDTILYRAYEGNTRINKIFKEVTFLTNIAFKDFKDNQGIILGNNINGMLYSSNSDKDKEKFSGAFVGNPMLLHNIGKILFKSHRSRNLFDHVVDYDYTSLYPTIIMMFNIFKTTLLGKIIIDPKNMTPLELNSSSAIPDGHTYDRGAQFIEDLETLEPIYFCRKWLLLPSVSQVMDYIDSQLDDRDRKTIITIKKKENKPKRKIKVRKRKVDI